MDSDKLTFDLITNAFKNERDTGLLFLEYQMYYRDNAPPVCKYLITKGYFFEYNPFTALWCEINSTKLNNRISNWLSSNATIIIRELAENPNNLEKIQSLSKQVNQITRFKNLEGVVKSIMTELEDDSIFDKLDKVLPDFLPIKDQHVINLKTGAVRHRVISDYFTWECPVKPVKKFSEFFLKTIHSIMCNNPERISYLKKIMGYSLTGSVEGQSYFIWHGKGSNGKSLILNMLQAVLGKACSPVSKGVLVDCGKKSGNGSEIITLKDLRLGTFSETNKAESLNEGMLKAISGGDTFRARALYKEEISFKVFMKLIVTTNHKPEFDGSDQGTTRRIKLLPFEAKFVSKNPNPEKNEFIIIEDLEKTLIEKYLDEFFTFCLEGAIEWYNDKKFNIIPDDVRKQQEKYIKEQNSFDSWVTEKIVEEKGFKITRSEAYKDYEGFCDEMGVKPQRKKDFFDKMADHVGPAVKIHGIMAYNNYKLKTEDDNNFI